MSRTDSDSLELNKAKKAWKPSGKNPRHRPKAAEENDPEEAKTCQLFRRVRSILNKLTPQMFQRLMKQVTELTINTEELLKGVIDLILEKAISEPKFSQAYANMCRSLMGLKVPTTDKPGITVNFRKLLLNRCQKEFEFDDEIFEKKQKELDAALGEEEKQRLKEELDDSKDRAERRSLGNIRFIGELFRLKMLTEAIMHDCIVKLLKRDDEESLKCLSIVLSITGKDLDFEKAKPRMDQYFKLMEKIIKERKTSFKVRFMLQDVLDLRRDKWVPRREDQGPKVIVRPGYPGSVSGRRPVTSTLNRSDALFYSSLDSDTRVSQSSQRWHGDRYDRRDDRQDNRRDDRREDRRNRLSGRLTVTQHTFRQEESSCKRDHRKPVNPVPVDHVPRAMAIIEEYLHVMEEALQCVQEMNSAKQLFVFVRNGLESTLERSASAREHMGLLLHQLIKTGMMPPQQYYKGLQEILEVAEDMAIEIPLFWLHLAELITPMLYEGGLPMGQLFKEIYKSLVPLGKASDLLVHILILLRKGMGHVKVGAMWNEAGLSWKDFLPEDEDVTKFVTVKKVEFTLGDESETDKKEEMSATEMSKQLDRLIQDKANNARIFDWIKANLEEQQTSSNTFVRVLMTCICQSAIIGENPYKVDSEKINHRAKLLQRYLKDEQKELHALYALQALIVEMEQPANLLRMFFDTMYDEDVIKEEAFFMWESSMDPAELQGKGVALKSVSAFFTWLREAEDESDNS